MCGAVTSLSQYTSIAWCSVKKESTGTTLFYPRKIPPLVPVILTEMHPVHTIPPHFSSVLSFCVRLALPSCIFPSGLSPMTASPMPTQNSLELVKVRPYLSVVRP